MGNPASVIRKKTEKRRKAYENRLGPGVYLPKEQREQVNAAVAKEEAETKAKRDAYRAKVKAEREKAKTAKKLTRSAPPAAETPKE